MPAVNILLSTYNGESYLTELLDSIRAQTYDRLVWHVRDDGSRDGTVAILRRWEADGRIQRLTVGKNVGAIASFFQLLRDADPESRFFAFADQDDIWKKGKIGRAVAALNAAGEDLPALYCCRLEYVDGQGVPLGYSPVPRHGMAFQNALVENMAAGCSMVMNRPARDLVLQHLPQRCGMHDWWCYLVISAFGRVIYDPRPQIAYRLHGQNDVGAPVTFLEDCLRRSRRFLTEGTDAFKAHAQARMFAHCFGHLLSGTRKRNLEAFVRSKRSFAERVRYGWGKTVFRQSTFDDLILRWLIWFNRY